MYCTSCGAENPSTGTYCTKCGKALTMHQSPVLDIPNYLAQSILVTLFCCLPFGIVAIINAAQVNGKLQAHDNAGALESSRKAKQWCWVSFWVGLGVGLIYLLVVVVGTFLQYR